MNEFFLSPSLWIVLLIAAAGVVTFVIANARLSTAGRWAGVGITVLAMAWYGTAYMIDTPLEASVKRTRAIIAAVSEQDWNKMQSLMNNNTTVLGFKGARDIADGARERSTQFGLKRVIILSLDSNQAGLNIDVALSAFSEQNMPPQIRTSWLFKYEVREDGILLANINPILGGDIGADEIQKRLKNVK